MISLITKKIFNDEIIELPSVSMSIRNLTLSQPTDFGEHPLRNLLVEKTLYVLDEWLVTRECPGDH